MNDFDTKHELDLFSVWSRIIFRDYGHRGSCLGKIMYILEISKKDDDVIFD